MMRRNLALFLMVLLVSFFLFPPAPLPGQGKAKPAVKLEYIDVGKPLPSCAFVMAGSSQGSGFLVDRSAKLVMTNFHVVGRSENAVLVFPVYEMGKALVTRDHYLTKAPRVRGKVLHADPVRDLAVIQLESLPNGVPEIPLAREPARVGDKTHMVGNPGASDKAWVWAGGLVKEIDTIAMQYATGQRVLAKALHIQADPAFGPGTSGGPAVNQAGELVGVMAAQKGSEPGRKVYIELAEVRVYLASVERGQGTAAIGAGDYAAAIQWCSLAIAVHGGDPLAYNERGVAYAGNKQYDAAIGDYNAALKLDADFSRTFRNRASANLAKGDAARAVADCDAALKLDPQYARAYLTRSKAYAKLGKNTESQADYQRAVKLDPSLK